MNPLKRGIKTLAGIISDLEAITRPMPALPYHDADVTLPDDELDEALQVMNEANLIGLPGDPDRPMLTEATWMLTAGEQDIMGVKPGDRMAGAIVGEPIDGKPIGLPVPKIRMKCFYGCGHDGHEGICGVPITETVQPLCGSHMGHTITMGTCECLGAPTPEPPLSWEGWAVPAILDVLSTNYPPMIGFEDESDGTEEAQWREEVGPLIAMRIACDPARAIAALQTLL